MFSKEFLLSEYRKELHCTKSKSEWYSAFCEGRASIWRTTWNVQFGTSEARKRKSKNLTKAIV